MKPKKTILLIGAFDTKGEEYAFLREQIRARGFDTLAMNIGVLDTTQLFPVDIEAAEVAKAAGADLHQLRTSADRGAAMKAMAEGAPIVVRERFEAGAFDGIIGMGGTGGTSVIAAGMRALPIGVPKLCVSTAAAGNVEPYVGTRDIVMMPSIVDVAGLNRVSRQIFARAAGAICGMAAEEPPSSKRDKPIIAASMFGNTTECVNACAAILEQRGYEVLIFHATGVGGRCMEDLVRDGLVDAVLDITTTEWADEICGGVFTAGPERLSAPGARGVPHLIVPGCIDMANFGAASTVPDHYRKAGRILYEWNPSVTLMRTNAEENARMGEIFAQKANEARGAVACLVPLRGFSILDGDGERFCDRAADQAFIDALKAGLNPGIPLETMDCNINDAAFSERASAMLLEMLDRRAG